MLCIVSYTYILLFLAILFKENQALPVCSDRPNTFLSPLLNGSVGSECMNVPVNAQPSSDGLSWSCVDGTVGAYGLKKYNLPCTSYSYSSALGNAQPCDPYASGGLSGDYNTFGWCVSCQIAGNCPWMV